MPLSCAVPNCNISKIIEKKLHIFAVPKDNDVREKWRKSIGISSLRTSQRICEKHFDEKCIIKEYIKYDEEGKIICQIPLKCARLAKGAIPTIFAEPTVFKHKKPRKNENHLDNRLMDHTYCLYNRTSDAIRLNNDSTLPSDEDSKTKGVVQEIYNKNISNNDMYKSVTEMHINNDSDNTWTRNLQNSSNKIILHSNFENSAKIEIASKEHILVPDHNQILSKETESSEILPDIETTNVIIGFEDIPENSEGNMPSQNTLNKTEIVNSFSHLPAFTFNFNSETEDVFKNYLEISIPKPWIISKTIIEEKDVLLCTYIVPDISVNGRERHIFEKTVIIKSTKEISYGVYSININNVVKMKLPQILCNLNALPEILKKFKDLRICKGIMGKAIPLLNCAVSQTCTGTDLRHKNCDLLSLKSERCNACKFYLTSVNRKMSRMRKKHCRSRISTLANPIDKINIKSMRMKLKMRTKQCKRLKQKNSLLIESLAVQQQKIASLTDDQLDKISKNQKTVMKEIVNAAKKSNPRGRRYSEEFIMLCMLMNIRSRSYYEFLRVNDIIPLPCTKTIRDYFSLMGNKCGFDEDFFKLLKKMFEKKDKLNRHGILLLDEISLRRSVTVSAKTLSYNGLTDFGDDGPQGESIKDLATHGLVLMFQSLTEKYTQPIAVFASKNSVPGEELAKLTLRAICLLESAGAMIHGIIGDGASTNKKMWKILGIVSDIDGLKTHFLRPMNDERKVFIFSDTPHLIKCIRNRLYNKGELKVNPEDEYVKWDYFTHLYNKDISLPGNCRVCPKISIRHVQLDNTTKMRVRFATQIFSNSVAAGLRFYLAHNLKEFNACETTADFCLRINNIFDALNRKQANEGLTLESKDFKVLEEAIKWLNNWEINALSGKISENEFLTKDTAHGLRMTITSTMNLCAYLIDNFQFKYLLTGKVNQDNLEKFFGTIRMAAGSNEHPTCPNFLLLYKLLSVYSLIKPPKYGNCTVTESKLETLLSVSEIKNIYKKSEEDSSKLKTLKSKLDNLLMCNGWEVHEIFEHDYSEAPVLDCVIYYVTEYNMFKNLYVILLDEVHECYLCKQVLKNNAFKDCQLCRKGLIECQIKTGVTQLVDMKSRGRLIHANMHFFTLISYVESCFVKHAYSKKVFDLTVDEVLENYKFTFPCNEHGPEILSYSIYYYIRLRMRQFTYQHNQKVAKQSAVQRKLSKLKKD